MERPSTQTLEFDGYPHGSRYRVDFSLSAATADDLRSYEQSSTQPQREAGDNPVRYSEHAGQPRLRSRSLAFDALFALAVSEMRDNSVRQIRDGSYNDGQPQDCDCFETGALWHYVWTRDIAYATALGLGVLDPVRSRNSLQFKVSGWRDEVRTGLAADISAWGQGRQIVQDTGTGGSWPISTDRVSWALGAEQVLAALKPDEAAAFRPLVYEALVNTLENDRVAAFDAADGLYRGEQSFLDWREQTYPRWMLQDVGHIGRGKALSTNVLHHAALELAARLAHELGHDAAGSRYAAWASDLKSAIRRRFWLDDAGLYSCLIDSSGAAAHHYDLLGQSLAIVQGIADESQARRMLAAYPVGPYGAPVIFPQQARTAVYHNRAVWPFVSAWALRAAARLGHVAAVDAHVDSLVRGAALNLSNMENLEWLSGLPLLVDPAHPRLGGPVVNSPRQLWSVGAYVSLVMDTLFGYRLGKDGLRIEPFVSAHMHRLMGGGPARLLGLPYRGRTLDIELLLPEAAADGGYYPVNTIRLNGQPVDAAIREEQLRGHNQVVVDFGPARIDKQPLNRVSGDPLDVAAPGLAAPSAVQISGLMLEDGRVSLELPPPAPGIEYRLFRDGVSVADALAGGRWIDPLPAGPAQRRCYRAEALDRGSGLHSHIGAPACVGPVTVITVDDARISHTGKRLNADAEYKRPYLKDWGLPGDGFTVTDVELGGRVSLHLLYSNRQHAINLGISNGVKMIRLHRDGRLVASGVVQMPHVSTMGGQALLRESTPLQLEVEPGRYRISIGDFYNMSYLQANALYNDAGGQDGISNIVDLAGITIWAQ